MTTRPLLALIGLLLIAGAAVPDMPSCTSEGLWVWPGSTTIVPNQQFMVEGYAMDENVAQDICKTYKPYLKSDAEKVELEVVEVCIGQFRVSQAVLKPVRLLQVGDEYEFEIMGLEKGRRLTHYDYKTQQSLPYKWKVTGDADLVTPEWAAAPTESGKHYDMFGCGPSLGVQFKVPSNEIQNLRVKTDVRALGSKKWTSYYLVSDKGVIDIGHGMCSGEFTLDEGKTFEAKFTLVDPAGNATEWAEGPIRFDRPSEMDE